MTILTIRDLPEDDAVRLTDRARANSRTVEAEAAAILHHALHQRPEQPELPQKGLGTAIHERWKDIGGVELELPPRNEYSKSPFDGSR